MMCEINKILWKPWGFPAIDLVLSATCVGVVIMGLGRFGPEYINVDDYEDYQLTNAKRIMYAEITFQAIHMILAFYMFYWIVNEKFYRLKKWLSYSVILLLGHIILLILEFTIAAEAKYGYVVIPIGLTLVEKCVEFFFVIWVNAEDDDY